MNKKLVSSLSVMALLLTLVGADILAVHAEGGFAGPRPGADVNARPNGPRPELNKMPKFDDRMVNVGEHRDMRASSTMNRNDNRMENRDDRMMMRASSTDMRRDMHASSTEMRRDERVNERVQKRCDQIGERIDNRVSKYGKNHDEHVEAYKENRDRLVNLIGKLDTDGKDTTTLKADLVVLDQKIKIFADLRAAYILSLQGTKTIPCGEKIENASSSKETNGGYTGAYKAGLDVARAQQKQVSEAAKDIAEFIRNTIVKDVKALNLKPKTDVQGEVQGGGEVDTKNN